MQSQQVQQILDVAGDLFFELGFWNAKVSEIAARSEISTASIYKAFESKDALFRAVLARGIEKLKILAKPPIEAGDPINQLLQASDRYHALCESALFRDLIRAPIEHNNIPLTFRRSMCRQIRSALEQLCMPPLQACAEVGLLDRQQIKEAFRLLSAYIEHQTIWYGLLVSPASKNSGAREQIADEAVRITLSAYPPGGVVASGPYGGAAQSVVATQPPPPRAPED
ncbi:TetR/AcrR family transcriptional regulator [Aquidulcibacter sp.]|uniref:TetR/AcrR family transcriptional regulator n=1 Tax=Aquidulcibacter sp. TaxID=2052990 RepID=UPI003BA45FC1